LAIDGVVRHHFTGVRYPERLTKAEFA
jgi:hypothetical protein